MVVLAEVKRAVRSVLLLSYARLVYSLFSHIFPVMETSNNVFIGRLTG
jgi:hypothetical protein